MSRGQAVSLGLADKIIEPKKRGNLRKMRQAALKKTPDDMRKLINSIYARVHKVKVPKIELNEHIKEPVDPNVYIKEPVDPNVYIKEPVDPNVYIKEPVDPNVYIKEPVDPNVYIKEPVDPNVYIKELKIEMVQPQDVVGPLSKVETKT
jgi:hypothetical protein